MHGETLVLDEVQWAEDEERGSAWTRLMLGGEYRHILLLGAVEALPLVRARVPARSRCASSSARRRSTGSASAASPGSGRAPSSSRSAAAP